MATKPNLKPLQKSVRDLRAAMRRSVSVELVDHDLPRLIRAVERQADLLDARLDFYARQKGLRSYGAGDRAYNASRDAVLAARVFIAKQNPIELPNSELADLLKQLIELDDWQAGMVGAGFMRDRRALERLGERVLNRTAALSSKARQLLKMPGMREEINRRTAVRKSLIERSQRSRRGKKKGSKKSG